MSYKYVILGGGVASGYAAREFVKQGVGKGELLIITNEANVAYERPALSKAYLFPENAARLPGFHTCVGSGGDKQLPEWYDEHGIKYMTNTDVIAVDVAAKTLSTAAGGTVQWQKLILATGCRPISMAAFKTPGAELPGVHYLRNVKDADAIVADIKLAKNKGSRCVIVGGGYIGMEVGAGMALNGLQTTLVFPEPWLMPRLFTDKIAAFYEGYYEGKGVQLIKGTVVSSFEAGDDGRVAKVVCKDGRTIDCDMVVVGVGAEPNCELFKDQLEMDKKGVKVDGKLRSSNADVYAVGDIACFALQLADGSYVRNEHVWQARFSAEHAVRAIMSQNAVDDYVYVPWFYSRVFELSWQFHGLSDGEAVFWGNPRDKKFGTYWVNGGKVVGAFMEGGSQDEFNALRALAKAQPPAPPTAELAQLGVEFAQSKL